MSKSELLERNERGARDAAPSEWSDDNEPNRKRAKWEFSNYLEWIGERQGILVDRDFVKNYFSDAKAYQDFVLDYAPSKKLIDAIEKYFFDWEN